MPTPRPTPSETAVGTFVEPRGMIRSVVAAAAGQQVLGAVGAAVASGSTSPDNAASPLTKGQIGYLGVFADQVVLFRAKRGAMKPKPTEEIVASAARSEIRTAVLEPGRIAGVLTISFNDDSAWAFDVPKVHLGGAQTIAAHLA